jgi:hypothetical protein
LQLLEKGVISTIWQKEATRALQRAAAGSPNVPKQKGLLMPAPSVASLSPNTGPTAGGTTVTITGTGFTGATGVSFNGTSAPFAVNSDTRITTFSPPHAAATVNIQVTNLQGTSPVVAADQFTYQPVVPAVLGLTPNNGPTTGGTSVSIGGSNFRNATGVSFGGTAAEFGINGDTQITAFAPAHAAGQVDVRVTNPDGTSAIVPNDQYNYQAAPPSVTGVGPNGGPTTGGTTVVIGGNNFLNATGVSFGSATAEFTIDSATQITALAPSRVAGTVDVRVTNPDGTSQVNQADQYTYQAMIPAVSSVTPNGGAVAGGTTVAIGGNNFLNASGVSFGGAAAAFAVNSATQITAFSPAHAAGQVDVQVTNPDGTSPANPNDQFTYA